MKKMECREYEKQVQSFLKDEMDDSRMQAFMEHVRICPRCYEELEIYHSVYDGLELIELEDAARENWKFADAGLRNLLEKRRQRIVRNKIKRAVVWVLLAVCAVGIVGTVSLTVLSESGSSSEAQTSWFFGMKESKRQ